MCSKCIKEKLVLLKGDDESNKTEFSSIKLMQSY